MTKRRRPFCLPVAVLLLAASSAASAHHVAGGHVPTRWTHGLLSGLAHPVIELDHLAFLLGAGVLVAAAGLRARAALLALLLFAGAGAAGTLLHARGVDLPAVEIGVALSLLLASLALLRPRLRPGPVALLALAAGLLHGHAYGEAIVGAGPQPLVAYLAGLAVVQTLMLVSVRAAWIEWTSRAPVLLATLRRLLALLLGLVGAWVLAAGAV